MKYHVTRGAETISVERTAGGIVREGVETPTELQWLGPGEAHLTYGGAGYRVFVRRTEDGWRVALRGRSFDLRVEDDRERAIRELAGEAGEAGGARELRAPMPGLVVRVLVEPGQAVSAGDPLLIVEAMKMENELRAEGPGVVEEIRASAGRAVDRDDVLVTFQEEEA